MKKLFLSALFVMGGLLSFSQEFMQITTVESVVPGGLGRSRMISVDEKGNMREEKLENFYSMVGVNFENIKNNDLAITRKINDMTKDGWELKFVTTGVESGQDKTGLFITRYLFQRELKK